MASSASTGVPEAEVQPIERVVTFREVKTQLTQLQTQLEKAREQVDAELQAANNDIVGLKEEVDNFKVLRYNELREKGVLRKVVEDQGAEIENLKKLLLCKDKEIEELEKRVNQKDEELQTSKKEISDLTEAFGKLKVESNTKIENFKKMAIGVSPVRGIEGLFQPQQHRIQEQKEAEDEADTSGMGRGHRVKKATRRFGGEEVDRLQPQ